MPFTKKSLKKLGIILENNVPHNSDLSKDASSYTLMFFKENIFEKI